MTARMDQLLKLHAADPADAELCYMIGLEHGKTGALDDALAWLDKALAADPAFGYAYFQKGKHLMDVGRDADATAALDAGIAAARQAGDAKALGELQELRASIDG
ncbi:MAG: hypothetical protein AAGI54_08615 [Planctomycetota bacterium]